VSDFPNSLIITMVRNGYIVHQRFDYGGCTDIASSWVFTNAHTLAQWFRENAPRYGLAGNLPDDLPEPGK